VNSNQSNIVSQSEAFVINLLNQLPDTYTFHNTQHTINVRNTVLELGKAEGLNSDELEIVELAALFHDTGYSKIYEGHEAAGVEIASNFLTKLEYPIEKIKQIEGLIMSTQMGFNCRTLSQKILKDADMSHIGKKTYPKTSNQLRKEWSTILGKEIKDVDWNVTNLDFLNKHEFLTPSAKALFQKRKEKNISKLRKPNKKKSMKAKSNKAAKVNNLNSSKPAQMIFKTALRNHIDLTSIADNKANIMLSINSILITIAIPTIAPKIIENPQLRIPAAILMLTSIISILFATLATRPGKNLGKTTKENIDAGKSNLFFFGNFYKMTNAEYIEGLDVVIANEKFIESSIKNDLYYLGKSLGRKFAMLRITYLVFAIGMLLTVITLGLSLI
jgi:predicted metal-dependent HD superfamily phosphohydrolase